MSGEMQDRPYQAKAIDFLSEGRGILIGPTGCGKTYISLQAAMSCGWKRLLIVVGRYSGLLSIAKELDRLGLDYTIVKKWTPKKRRVLWEKGVSPDGDPLNIVVALYQTVRKDVELLRSHRSGFDMVICDECHMISDRRTLTFKAIEKICRGRSRFFMTATAQAKGPEDLWAPLHIVAPRAFPSYHKFIGRYCLLENDGYSDKVVGVRADRLSELRFRIAPYIHTISKKAVQGYIPARVRTTIPLELPTRIRRAYQTLWKDSMLVLPDQSIFMTPVQLAKYTAVRKLLCCPALIHDNFGVGIALESVWEHANAENKKPHVVIFSDFKEPFPIWRAWLEEEGAEVCILQGGMSDSDTRIEIDRFSRLKDKRPSILLCTIPFAESFDLLSPQDAYFIGWSWDQRKNYQAEGRLTRGTKTHANLFYCIHDNTVDQYMLDVLDEKVRNTRLVASVDAD